MISSKFSQRFSENFFKCTGNTLSLNDFSDVLDFGQLMDFVHVPHVNTKLTHVHLKGVTVDNDKLDVV